MSALIAEPTTKPVDPPPDRTLMGHEQHSTRTLAATMNLCDYSDSKSVGGDKPYRHYYSAAATDGKPYANSGGTMLNGGEDDDVDQLLNSSGGRGIDAEDGLDLCSSTWKSVETMARALAVGQSVMSTISRCYSLPNLVRSGPRGAAAASRRSAREAGTDAMHSSLLSGRFAAKALAVFRRCVCKQRLVKTKSCTHCSPFCSCKYFLSACLIPRACLDMHMYVQQ